MTPAQPQLQQQRTPVSPHPREQRGRPPTETAVPPEAVWTTLSPPLQAQIRQALLRIAQEVLYEPPRH